MTNRNGKMDRKPHSTGSRVVVKHPALDPRGIPERTAISPYDWQTAQIRTLTRIIHGMYRAATVREWTAIT